MELVNIMYLLKSMEKIYLIPLSLHFRHKGFSLLSLTSSIAAVRPALKLFNSSPAPGRGETETAVRNNTRRCGDARENRFAPPRPVGIGARACPLNVMLKCRKGFGPTE